jgi:hypothetical protein
MEMPLYMVRFMKDVLGGNGHREEVCQQTVELDAPDADTAKRQATRIFCERCGLSDWSLHADRIDVTPADFPS